MNCAEVSGAPISPGVRRLTAPDVPDAYELSRVAGWNQTEADWHRLLTLSPDGCFCIEGEGRVVATTTLVRYDCVCAWVGMVLTHPNWRQCGLARRLVRHAIAAARALGIASIKLDATNQGRSLYESFGFIAEQSVERWERPGVATYGGVTRNYSSALDRVAYGYSRADLLKSLSVDASGTDRTDGYVLTRPGAIRSYVGPCVARDPEAARQLLTSALNAVPVSGWFWDLLVGNRSAAALAANLGFKPVRSLVRMSMGPSLREQDQNIYALAGLEFG